MSTKDKEPKEESPNTSGSSDNNVNHYVNKDEITNSLRQGTDRTRHGGQPAAEDADTVGHRGAGMVQNVLYVPGAIRKGDRTDVTCRRYVLSWVIAVTLAAVIGIGVGLVTYYTTVQETSTHPFSHNSPPERRGTSSRPALSPIPATSVGITLENRKNDALSSTLETVSPERRGTSSRPVSPAPLTSSSVGSALENRKNEALSSTLEVLSPERRGTSSRPVSAVPLTSSSVGSTLENRKNEALSSTLEVLPAHWPPGCGLECKDGFGKMESFIFQNGEPSRLCYKAFNDRTTYNGAVSRCSLDGGTLAMPRDTATNNFLIDLKNEVDNDAWFRFGLTDEEGVWMWDDNVPLGDFRAWGTGEPNNAEENCAEYFPETFSEYKAGSSLKNRWNDGPCTTADRTFICQVSPPSVLSPEADVNIALGKAAFQTSDPIGAPASRAVDGNTDTNYLAGSCTHTDYDPGEADPSWWVDLGQPCAIDRVVIFNRQECCPERLNPFNIHIGDSDQVSENPKCGGDHKIDVNQPSISVSCQGMRGRYVGVRLPGPSRVLTLCEVQVFSGQWLEQDSSWAVDSAGTPWVDENGGTYDAAKALDGDIGTYWNPQGKELYHNNWYIALDLMASYTLTRIAVNNFGDTTHDTAAFTLQKSQVGSPYTWEDVVSVDNVIAGTRQRQEFGGFRGTARYWRFVITRTYSGNQPWLPELDFYGFSRVISHDDDMPNVPCKHGYRRVGWSCIRLGTVQKSFLDAQQACNAEGATLAMPKTEELDLALRRLVKMSGGNSDSWIGLRGTYNGRLGKWEYKWEDGSLLGKYQGWYPGEPRNRAESWLTLCVQYWRGHTEWDTMWDDAICDDKKRYICQSHLPNTKTLEIKKFPPLPEAR
ncbi:hypothetical protein Bbelb_138690 [Branchiostoma belcheri]|nr:hypothetical protein Bbelb_138690 [Branchiostoma belcheri]